MGIEFRKDRNGELIREWYGSYSVNGRRRARRLGVSIKGKPPASGKRRASIYDFHALRTTFVTLAAVYGIPLETVRLFTGHSGVAVLQQYYDRAKGTDVAAKFAAAMPASLTSAVPSSTATSSDDTLDKEGMKSLASKLTPAQRKQLMKELLNAD